MFVYNHYICSLIGSEFAALVEFAPFQKVPKSKIKKNDPKKGTIEQGES